MARSPAETLAAAVTKSRGVNLKLAVVGDSTTGDLRGSYDAGKAMASYAGTSDGEPMTIVVTASTMYLAGPSDLAGKTVRMDIGRFAAVRRTSDGRRGTKANDVKFVANVDDQGYLAKFKVTLPGLDGAGLEYDVTMSDFVGVVTVAEPAGPTVIDAPAAAYQQEQPNGASGVGAGELRTGDHRWRAGRTTSADHTI